MAAKVIPVLGKRGKGIGWIVPGVGPIGASSAPVATAVWDNPNLDTLNDGDEVWICEDGQVFSGTVAKRWGDTYWTADDGPFVLRGFGIGMYWTIKRRKAGAASGPVTCTRCNTINEFAKPNQSDGSYVCYNCR